MDISIENRIVSRIYGSGRGWSFSQTDFSQLGSAEAIHVALHRLEKKGTIRRVFRGIYDYPLYSKLLEKQLSPDMVQVAAALSRKFGWRIHPSGAAALNLMGLSSQVPGRILYMSDGPTRRYMIGKTELVFKHTALKEASFKYPESALIVQGLKSLGREAITDKVVDKIRSWLPRGLRKKVFRDTSTVTAWVYSAIWRICREESDAKNSNTVAERP